MPKLSRKTAAETPLNPTPVSPPGTALTSPQQCDPENPLGLSDQLDPANFDWYPIARRKREDGWTHSRQRKFIEVLADTGSVSEAARQVTMSKQSCYRLRRSPGAEAFARAWDAAIEEASRRLVDAAFERALNGVAEPVFDKDGACFAVRRKYNDRLLMFLLRAHQPSRYRRANSDLRHREEPILPPHEPVSAALEQLTPPQPANPAALLPPDELAERLAIAEILDGKLPAWQDDRSGDCDLEAEQIAPDMD